MLPQCADKIPLTTSEPGKKESADFHKRERNQSPFSLLAKFSFPCFKGGIRYHPEVDLESLCSGDVNDLEMFPGRVAFRWGLYT
jgi:hypothetical protein